MTKAEQSFIDQYTRKLLIDWAHHQVTAPTDPFGAELPTEKCGHRCSYGYDTYVEYAITRGWVSKDGRRVLAKGFATATSALKRGC